MGVLLDLSVSVQRPCGVLAGQGGGLIVMHCKWHFIDGLCLVWLDWNDMSRSP